MRGQTMAASDGSVCVYCNRYDKPAVLLNGSAAAGLKLRAAAAGHWAAEVEKDRLDRADEKRWLAGTNANPHGPYSYWKLPQSVEEKYWRSNLLANRDGLLIAAIDGIHFMDWECRARKV